MYDTHFKDGVGRIDPFLHNVLEQMFTHKFLFGLGKLDIQGFKHFVSLGIVTFHDGGGELADWVHDELGKGSFEWLTFIIHIFLFPLLGGTIKVVVTPKFFHQFSWFRFEFFGVDSGELGDCEAPAVFSGTEGNGSFFWLNKQFTHIFLLVGGQDNVNHINNTDKVVVHLFTIVLQF